MPKIQKVKPGRSVSRSKSTISSRISPVTAKPVGDITMNIYGRSGTGKTTFACTFPKPLLILGTEDGTNSVSDVDGVYFVAIETTDDFRDLIEMQESSRKYRTLVLDTASVLQDIVLKEILGISDLPAQRSWGMASREQWGQCTLQTKELLRAFLGLRPKTSCSVIVVAQEREFHTDNEGEILMPYIASALSPSVTGWLNPACDYIAQTFIREKTVAKTVKIGTKEVRKEVRTGDTEFCLRTAPDPVFTTKFRVPRGTILPKVVVDPDYDRIIKIIRGKGK